MAYKALYRIYRPQTFDEVVGQKYILQTIKNAIEHNKIAHAYLFSGPRGTGKTTLAKLLAKGVNCTASTNRPCNECDNCKAIAQGTYPDVIEIDAASNNGVDEIREIIDKVKYAPIAGKYKIYIIDEVHMLSTGAFNALLKTLEEPPAHIIFILATTDVHKVIPTIISRCQRFDFNKVSQTDIKLRIKDILEQENIKYENDVVSLIAELADGGVRDALGILDQTIAYAGDNLTGNHVRDIYGVASTAEIVVLIDNILNRKIKESLNFISDFDQRGVDLVRLTNGILNILKETVIFNYSNDSSNLELLTSIQVEKLGSLMNNNIAFRIIDTIVDTLANFKKVNSPRSLLELAVVKLCTLEEKITTTQKTEAKAVPQKTITFPKAEPIRRVEVIPEVKPQALTETINIDEAINPVKSDKDLNGKDQMITFTDKELLNVLVQASKEDKDFVSGRWSLITQYMSKPQFSYAASLVIDGVPFAATENALILGFQLAPQARASSKASNYKLIISFFNELFGKEMVFYSITDEAFKALRLDYINRKSLNKLPQAFVVTMPEFIDIKEEVKLDAKTEKALELGAAIFGEKFKVKE
jgi:DNA polymerase-3 subunit gamma/tau